MLTGSTSLMLHGISSVTHGSGYGSEDAQASLTLNGFATVLVCADHHTIGDLRATIRHLDELSTAVDELRSFVMKRIETLTDREFAEVDERVDAAAARRVADFGDLAPEPQEIAPVAS